MTSSASRIVDPRNMIRAFFVILICCSAVACMASDKHVPIYSTDKIDPSLLMEIEKYKSTQQIHSEVAVLIRTKKEVDAMGREAIEKEGGRIGSVIGDIMTAKVPVMAISKIAAFDFVVYIEKAKKQRLR